MVADSSVWIEIFLKGPLADLCEKNLNQANTVYIPSLCFFEIYKKIKSKTSETLALEVIGSLSQFTTHELTREIALLAADLSLEYQLGMADSLILAHARTLRVPLFTLDNDFAAIPGVKVLRST